MTRILILGGTTEASRLADTLALRGLPATLSYAGRTEAPRAQALPTRIGGFGGAEGLADWLRAEGITRVVDATHPFAARISANAVAACQTTGVPLLAYQRPAWQAQAGDDWQYVRDLPGAVAGLAGPARRIFLAIGRQHIADFAAQPQHHYLLRLVDPPQTPLPLPDCAAVIARGPFDVAGDLALLREHRIDLIIAKNAGGSGAEAKLIAARQLRLPVVLIERPAVPPRPIAATLPEVLDWLHADLGV